MNNPINLSKKERQELFNTIVKNLNIDRIDTSNPDVKRIVNAITTSLRNVIINGIDINRSKKDPISNMDAVIAYKQLNGYHLKIIIDKVEDYFDHIGDMESYVAVVMYDVVTR